MQQKTKLQMQSIGRDLLHMEHLYRMVNFFFFNLTDSLSFFSLFGAWCLEYNFGWLKSFNAGNFLKSLTGP